MKKRDLAQTLDEQWKEGERRDGELSALRKHIEAMRSVVDNTEAQAREAKARAQALEERVVALESMVSVMLTPPTVKHIQTFRGHAKADRETACE